MKLTWILVLACILGVVYAIMSPTAFDDYGFSQNNFLSKPYVIVTSIFLHGSFDHLASNLLVLIFFGLAVESELGWRKMSVIFFLGAFAGDLMSVFVYAPSEIAIGASAGVFALIGVGMLVRPMDLSFYPLVIPIPLALLGMAYALYNAYGFIVNTDPSISYIAHFGGLFVGLAFGLRQKGWKKGLKTIAITFLIMIIIPLLWVLLT
jgi:membrane associated rhomboid family serine protease